MGFRSRIWLHLGGFLITLLFFSHVANGQKWHSANARSIGFGVQRSIYELNAEHSEMAYAKVNLFPVNIGFSKVDTISQIDVSYQLQGFRKGSPNWYKLEPDQINSRRFFQHGFNIRYQYFIAGTPKSKIGLGIGTSVFLVLADFKDVNEIPTDSALLSRSTVMSEYGDLKYEMIYYDRFLVPVYFTANASIAFKQYITNKISLLFTVNYNLGFLELMRTDYWVTDVPRKDAWGGNMINRGSSCGGEVRLIYRFRK